LKIKGLKIRGGERIAYAYRRDALTRSITLKPYPMKDRRFITAGKLIRTNEIKTFSEVIDVIPKTVVAKALGINPERFNRLLENIDLFVIKDLVNLAGRAGIEFLNSLLIFTSQLNESRSTTGRIQ
jgi:hypothetical protein